MKKLLSFVLTAMFAMTGWAQENLALSATASASLNAEAGAAGANDGNTGTRWSSNVGSASQEEKDNVWFQLEWADPQTFNTIKMLCEGAMGSAFGTHSYVIYIVHANQATTLTCTGNGDNFGNTAKASEAIDGAQLVGTYVEKTGAIAGGYALAQGAESLTFLKLGEESIVGPFRAYLNLAGASANALSVRFEGSVPTSIDSIKAGAQSGIIYNLAGQRTNLQAGSVVIMGGKKMMVK